MTMAISTEMWQDAFSFRRLRSLPAWLARFAVPDQTALGDSGEPVAQTAQRYMAIAGDNDMIEQLDLEELPSADELASNSNICFGRGRIPRWMVVHQQHGLGRGNDRGAVHFTTMDEQGIERSGCYQVMTPDPTSRGKMERNARLHIRIECRQCRDVHPPVLGRLLGCVAFVQSVGQRTVTQGNDFEFYRVRSLPLTSTRIAFR
jgi:hypothetical protein